MEEVQKQMKNPWATLVVGLVVGALFGLIVLGWGLFPVTWTDASPADLTASYQQQWVDMAINNYAYTNDTTQAQANYTALGEDAQYVLIQAGTDLGTISVDDYAAYVMAVEPENVTMIMMGTPVAESSSPSKPGTFTSTILPIMCGILTAIIAAAGIFLVLKRLAKRQPEEIAPEPEGQQEVVPEVATSNAEAPMVHFTTTYGLGDDLYDDSFSIDSPTGEFMGECGAGISETIGVGDPKKVTAFEVWLFDKNDIQTVTKVLMSEFAFGDEATRNRLTAKGEPVLVDKISEIVLETQTLHMVVKIVGLGYGEGPLPENSFFDRMVLDLSIWSK